MLSLLGGSGQAEVGSGRLVAPVRDFPLVQDVDERGPSAAGGALLSRRRQREAQRRHRRNLPVFRA